MNTQSADFVALPLLPPHSKILQPYCIDFSQIYDLKEKLNENGKPYSADIQLRCVCVRNIFVTFHEAKEQ